MPASYAHYRFGRLGLAGLPEQTRLTVQRFQQLYDVGQHGPDFFFYFQPLFHTKIGALGSHFHRLSGKEFFEAAAEKLRNAPSEGAEAYLFGVLGHYTLDSACHPLVKSTADEGKIGHTELETEFDRHLLTIDGKEPPHLQNLGAHMHLTWGESATVAGFYPPVGAFTVRRSVATMAAVNRVLAIRNRKLVESIFRLGGSTGSESVMYPRPNHKCVHLMQPLTVLFEESLSRYPSLAEQLFACIHSSSPLGEDFEKPFG